MAAAGGDDGAPRARTAAFFRLCPSTSVDWEARIGTSSVACCSTTRWSSTT